MEKNQSVIICKQRKHLFCGNHCKIPLCSPPQGGSLSTFAGGVQEMPQVSRGSAVIHQGEEISLPE